MLTCGSLFAGIGGFDLGLERAGMRCLWQCEIDPYCQRVLEKHWPDVLRVRDVRDVNVSTVPVVDLICGGFPCQDISIAGQGAGIDGERSGLWSEMLRVVCELRPRYVVVENVAALLTRGLGRVLGDLASIGYDAEWDCIPASAFGAPHRRDRFWLVAYPSSARRRQDARSASGDEGPYEGWAAQQHHLAYGDGQGHRTRQGQAAAVANAECVNHRAEVERDQAGWTQADGPPGGPSGPSWWAVEPDVGRVAYGVPARTHRLRLLGNALVPQIAEWIGRRIIDYEEGRVAA